MLRHGPVAFFAALGLLLAACASLIPTPKQVADLTVCVLQHYGEDPERVGVLCGIEAAKVLEMNRAQELAVQGHARASLCGPSPSASVSSAAPSAANSGAK